MKDNEDVFSVLASVKVYHVQSVMTYTVTTYLYFIYFIFIFRLNSCQKADNQSSLLRMDKILLCYVV